MSAERITRKDVEAGRIGPREIENGVVVPPWLRVNTETLHEHQQRMQRDGWRLLNREEARRIFAPIDVAEYFGPEEIP